MAIFVIVLYHDDMQMTGTTRYIMIMFMILTGQNLDMRPAAAMMIRRLSEIAINAARQGGGGNQHYGNPFAGAAAHRARI